MTELTGRELDASVAVKCMEAFLVAPGADGRWWMRFRENPLGNRVELPYFSKNMDDTTEVINWIIKQGYRIEISIDKDGAYCEIWGEDIEFPSYWHAVAISYSDVLPESICQAALGLFDFLEKGNK